MMKKWLAVVFLLSLCMFNGLNVMSTKAETVNQPQAIDMEKAKQIALGKVPGTVVSAKIEKDDGMVKYEVIVQAKDGKYEVEIDKATGKILEIEKEGSRSETGNDDDHEGDDDHHEGDDDSNDD